MRFFFEFPLQYECSVEMFSFFSLPETHRIDYMCIWIIGYDFQTHEYTLYRKVAFEHSSIHHQWFVTCKLSRKYSFLFVVLARYEITERSEMDAFIATSSGSTWDKEFY